jgi:FkbM family methyltransferase
VLISMSALVKDYGVKPRVIAHIGAHKGEEYEQYAKIAPADVYWFEANPDQIAHLDGIFRKDPTQHLVSGAVWDTDGEAMEFKITNNTLSSSLFALGAHSVIYPDIVSEREVSVTTLRLDSFFKGKEAPDFINLDIQGAELHALKGATGILLKVTHIYTEVSYLELYLGAPLAGEIDQFLTSFGFKKVLSRKLPKDGWGDVLYINTRLARLPKRRFFSRKLANLKYSLASLIYSLRLSAHKIRSSRAGFTNE